MNDTALSIGDVSRRSGFSPDTLRYYERLGLIERPARTPAGRRAYDRRALERLQFIARAKELDCSLDEIRSLVTAFDQECADVAGQLSSLVDTKITVSQQRVAAMVAFTAQLQEFRQALRADPADGPCGPDCACSGATVERDRPSTLVVIGEDPTIACSLPHEDMSARIDEWQTVLAGVVDRAPIDSGVRLSFGPDADLAEIARLARAEWACCSFFSFAMTVDGRGIGLEVRAPNEAQALVAGVFGVAA